MNLFLLIGLLLAVSFAIYVNIIFNMKKDFSNDRKKFVFYTAVSGLFLASSIYLVSWSVVRYAMLSDPTILTDTIQKLEEADKKKQMEITKEALKNITEDDSKYAPILGNADGKIVIYEFFDYNCGYCRKGNSVVKEVLKSEKDVKVVLKNYPIFPPSRLPAKAAIASREQGLEKSAVFHHALFEANLSPEKGAKDMDKAIKSIVMTIAKKSGLDVKKLEKDMASSSVEEELLRTRKLAGKLGIQGTPAFIVGNEFFRGYVDVPVMINAIKAARK